VLSGGAGNDKLDGGAGADTLDGGAGDDTLTARDGAIDTLACGVGQDGGIADATDVIGADCEAVVVPAASLLPGGVDPGAVPAGSVPAGTVPGPSPAGVAGAPTANAVPPTIPPQTVAVSASGVASVRIVCPPDSGGCRGTVAIELPQAGAHAKADVSAARAPGVLRLGQKRFTAKAGTSPTIRVRLSKRGRQRILRGRRAHCRISVTTVSGDGKTVVTTQQVTLTAARRQPPKPAKPPRGHR
jgi:Ca2+-binding RTX toxin-like protein